MKQALMLVVLLLVASTSYAFQVTAVATWTDNNTDIEGFKLYQEDVIIVTLADPTARTWTGMVDVPEGRTTFYLAAYKGTKEAKSEPAILEYMNVDLSSPTLIIKFAQ